MDMWDLEQLLSRAVPYETWCVPLDPRLRRSTLLSGLGLVAGLLLTTASGSLLAFAATPFWIVLPDLAVDVTRIVAAERERVTVAYLLCMVAVGALGLLTCGYQHGRLLWHWVLFWINCAGTLHALALALGLALLLLNMLIWLSIALLIILCASIVALLLRRIA